MQKKICLSVPQIVPPWIKETCGKTNWGKSCAGMRESLKKLEVMEGWT
jgi:hypothetical protein